MASEIRVPRLGWSMEEGTFAGWLKAEGDFVKVGDPLFTLEGEKATQDIEAVDAGILHIPPSAPPPGTVISVGGLLGFLLAQGENAESCAAPCQDPATEAPLAPTVAPASAVDAHLPADVTPHAPPSVRRLARQLGVHLNELDVEAGRNRATIATVRAAAENREETVPADDARSAESGTAKRRPSSPRARRAARRLGIAWSSLAGSGAGGRVREADILAAAARQSPSAYGSAAVPGSEVPDSADFVPVTPTRRLIAQRMLASRQHSAPVTLFARADATNLVSLRNQFKNRPDAEIVPAYTDILVRTTAAVLRKHRLLAGRWEDTQIRLPSDDEIDIGVAVDAPAGLVVPVIRHVLGQSLVQVARQSLELIDRARAGTLTAADMQGGVFTVTNLGAFGIETFTPILNPGETAILGLGEIRREPIVRDDGHVEPRYVLPLSLTFDHRVVDGAPAARFMGELRLAIENPSAWLLGD